MQSLLNQTKDILRDPKYAKQLANGEIELSSSEKDNQVYMFFTKGIISPGMKDVLDQLISKERISKMSLLLHYSNLRASFNGFIMGDVLGWSLFDSEGHPLAIEGCNSNHAIGQPSYNTDMMLLLMNNTNMKPYNAYNMLNEYANYGTSGDIRPTFIKVLLKNFDPEIPIEQTYISRFKNVTKKSWDHFFKDEEGKDNGYYGGCFARIIPLAMFMNIDNEIMDVWLTDPRKDAFRSVHFIVTILRLLYTGHDVKSVLKQKLPFFPEKREKEDNIYVKATTYAYLSLTNTLRKSLKECYKKENKSDLHVLYPIICAIAGARDGNEFFKDAIVYSNLMKIRDYKLDEGVIIPKDLYVNNSEWDNLINTMIR